MMTLTLLFFILAERYPAPPTPEGKVYPSNSVVLQRWFLPVSGDLSLGLVGGLLPGLRAARMPIAAGLREL